MAENKPKKEEETKKIKRPTALKRDLQNERRKLKNRSFKSSVATTLRSLKEISKEDKTATQAKLNAVYSLLDKGVKKGIIKQNKANRVKAQMSTLATSK